MSHTISNLHARVAERADRVRVRTLLVAAVKLANSHGEDTDTIDVPEMRRDISWELL